MMTSEDELWYDLLMRFTHDVASHLTPIRGYADMLTVYFEGLLQQKNVPPVPIEDGTPLTSEQALDLIRLIQQHAKELYERKYAMSKELGFATGYYERTPYYEGKARDLLVGFTHDVVTHGMPIQSGVAALVLYLEGLAQQRTVRPVSLGASTNFSVETALTLIRIMQDRAKQLQELHTTMNHELSKGLSSS
jgi:hypothetical protein